MIKDARDDLEYFETKFGIKIHTVDQVPDPSRRKKGSGRIRFISHTFGFRSIFFLMFIVSLIMLIT